MRIEAVKTQIVHLPVTPHVLHSLRETARLCTTHYSTMIEGNRLEQAQVESVLHHEGHFPGRERDEYEIKGYYATLAQVETWVTQVTPITEDNIQRLHAYVMAGGKKNIGPTPYRDGQNVIRDARTRELIYMPPEAGDVPTLMSDLLTWLHHPSDTPCPIVAGIAHYQFATIHPYYDGNGRTARLLTTWILHAGGYDLKGLYSLEEYYARHLDAYYDAMRVGPSHNYYMGREDTDITGWLSYFIEGMSLSFEKVLKHMQEEQEKNRPDYQLLLRQLNPEQRKALSLFKDFETVTSRQIGALFGFQPRTSALLCAKWVANGFLVTVDPANRSRKYQLSPAYQPCIL